MAGSLNATPNLSVVIMGLERKHFNGLDFFYARRDYSILSNDFLALLFICMGCSKLIKSIYLIGSLRNPEITKVGKLIRERFGIEVFDEWLAAGPEADDSLRDHFREKNYSYAAALDTYAAKHIYEFDKYHLDRTDAAMLVMPAGKSAHLELGYTSGRGKPAFILMDKEPDRYDLMYQFATKVFMNDDEMIEGLKEYV